MAWRDDPGAFSGLDEVIRSLRVVSGGQHAARLRQLRRFAGPVPPWYPGTQPVAGPIRGVREAAWNAARLIAGFGEQLIGAADSLPGGTACPLISAEQLSWGVRFRPSPGDGHVALRLPVNRRLARRTWMCLPGLPAPGTAIAEVPSTATAMAQQVWRGIHEGAHLDHLGALARARGGLAPSPGEFGAGLLLAESYAMAVEILAGVECVLAGEGDAVRQLGAGLIERATRLPGGSNPAAEFVDLPTLAEVYVLGPLEVLSDGPASATLPAELTGSLLDRWRAACAAYPPARDFGASAARLVRRPLALRPGGLTRTRNGVYECRPTGIAMAARAGLIGGRGSPAPQVSPAGRMRQPCSPGNFIYVNATQIDMLYLAALSSLTVLTGSGAGNALVSRKGRMRGGPQGPGWPMSRAGRAAAALVSGKGREG